MNKHIKKKYPVPKTKCKYCSHNVSVYYIHIHHTTKKCSKLQAKIIKNTKLLNDIISNNIDEYKPKYCILCEGKIRKQAIKKEDEQDIDYNKVHKKCLEKQLLKSNNNYNVKICDNPSIGI